MLQTIREHTQGWIAGTIITIIILTFALWGIHSYFVGGANDSVVAKVNGVDITKEQLALAYERIRRQTQAQYGASNQTSAKDEAALKKRALQSLIEMEVQRQASHTQGFRISDVQIDNYLQNMPEFQVNGEFSLERFQEILSATLLSTGEFLELIKTSLLMDQPKLGIIFSSYALPDETNYTIKLVNQERDIDYVILPSSYFLSKNMMVAPESIQTYYNHHQRDFMTPEQVNVEYLQLSLNDLASAIKPSELELKNFYNENINAYTKPMEWKLANIVIPSSPDALNKAEAVFKSLQQGEDFSQFARQYTQTLNGQTAMTLSHVPAELQKVVSGLTNSGQLSAPIKTANGIVIVKAVEVSDPKIHLFDEVKDKVKEMFIHQRAEEKFAEIRDQLADLTYEHPDSLQMAAKDLNLPIKTSDLFTKEKAGKDKDISQFKKVRDVAFSNDVLNLQNNSDVIQLNPETVIVIRVKSHIASTLLPLKTIRKQIEDKLKTEQAELQAAKLAEDLQNKLQNGGNPQLVFASYPFTWSKAGYIGRYSTKIDSAILDLAFRLPHPDAVQRKVVYGMTRIPNGYAIAALNAVRDGTVPDKKQYKVFAEQVQNSEGLLEYELYKQSDMQHAKIKVIH